MRARERPALDRDSTIASVDDLLTEPLEVEDGYVQVPEGPGFGIELDHDVVEEHAYTGEGVHTINLFEKDWEKREVDLR